MASMTKKVLVAKLRDLSEGTARIYEVAGTRIVLCRLGNQVYALENTCSHDDGPLGEGKLDGYAIECPRHGARFDIRDGSVLRMPAAGPIRTFGVHIEGEEVYVEID